MLTLSKIYYINRDIGMSDIDDYILAHISPEPALQRRVYRDTYLHHVYPQMCSGHLQGRLLKMLVEISGARRVLELGAFTGYATLCLAEGLPAGGELHTIEIDDEMAGELQDTFNASGHSSLIHLHIGDALEIVPALDPGWDLVYVDANKRQYPEYYEMLVPIVHAGGLIIADNTLWYGKITDMEATDPQTVAIRRFNDMVATDPRVEKVMLPLRDGMTIIRVINPHSGKIS